jgi:lipopolysaccharide transport system ATP-binding protein
MSIIETSHVTKEYHLGQLHSLKQTALNELNRLVGRPVKKRALFKALDDVNFTVEPGEVLGIIGHNGAGKSTLLKILAGITKPTLGAAKVKGRVAPLIEVGAGLVGDLTGRENIYLNGAILGLSRKEIKSKFDEIVSFAELEDFINTPIKRYSSGMSVRLGFAIATSVTADILIVDEVLAVGDLAFQRKCFDRMENLIKKQGRTVLIVSHNIRQIERMCQRVILIDHGIIRIDGKAKAVCNGFYEQSDSLIVSQQSRAGNSKVMGTGEVELLEIQCVDKNGNKRNEILSGEDACFTVRLRTNKQLTDPLFVFGIHTTDFVYITTVTSENDFKGKTILPGTYLLSVIVNQFSLLPGVYSVRFSVDVEDPIKNILYGENLCHFTIRSYELQRSASYCEGFFLLQSRWQLKACT